MTQASSFAILPDAEKWKWRVYFPAFTIGSNEMRSTMQRWCRDNCQGKFRVRLSHVRFDNAPDADLFYLRWR